MQQIAFAFFVALITVLIVSMLGGPYWAAIGFGASVYWSIVSSDKEF